MENFKTNILNHNNKILNKPTFNNKEKKRVTAEQNHAH